jgi:hypothetical protein
MEKGSACMNSQQDTTYPSYSPPDDDPPPFDTHNSQYVHLGNILAPTPSSVYPSAPPLDSTTPQESTQRKGESEVLEDDDTETISVYDDGKRMEVWGVVFVAPTKFEVPQWRLILAADLALCGLFFCIFCICGLVMVRVDMVAMEKATMIFSLIAGAICFGSIINVMLARSAIAVADMDAPYMLIVRIVLFVIGGLWSFIGFVVSVVGANKYDEASMAVGAAFHGLFFVVTLFFLVYEANEFFGLLVILGVCCSILHLGCIKNRLLHPMYRCCGRCRCITECWGNDDVEWIGDDTQVAPHNNNT